MRNQNPSDAPSAFKRYLTTAIAAASVLAWTHGASAAPTSCQDHAQATWTKYRAAILTKDAVAAATLTRFPLSVRGQLDDSDKTRIDAATFKARFNGFMSLDTGLRATAYPVRKLAEDTPSIATPNCTQSTATFDVGPMTFTRIGETWRLTSISEE